MTSKRPDSSESDADGQYVPDVPSPATMPQRQPERRYRAPIEKRQPLRNT